MRVRRQDVTSLIADLIIAKWACRRMARRLSYPASASAARRHRVAAWSQGLSVDDPTVRSTGSGQPVAHRPRRTTDPLRRQGIGAVERHLHVVSTQGRQSQTAPPAGGNFQRVWRFSSPRQGPSHPESSGTTAESASAYRHRRCGSRVASTDPDGPACKPARIATPGDSSLSARLAERHRANQASSAIDRAASDASHPLGAGMAATHSDAGLAPCERPLSPIRCWQGV
jgi:hypothetical protein